MQYWIVTLLVLFLSALIFYGTSDYLFQLNNNSNVDTLEDALIEHLYGDMVESDWLNVKVQHSSWKGHLVVSKALKKSKNLREGGEHVDTEHELHAQTMVLIHGYGATSALAWRNTIPTIQGNESYNVIAIDLPGFGRTPGPLELLSASTTESFDMYCDYFDEIWRIYDLPPSFVVAHSIGGFIFTQCASRNPSLVSRLLLSNVPGFFSANGGYDYIWATFFTLGLPHTALRLAGPSFGRSIIDFFDTLLQLYIHPVILDYWHAVQIGSAMQCHVMIAKYITHQYYYAMGVGLAFPPLLNITNIPVAVLYGEEDPIAPPHIGEFIQNISGIPLHLVKASHVPYSTNSGRDFLKVRW